MHPILHFKNLIPPAALAPNGTNSYYGSKTKQSALCSEKQNFFYQIIAIIQNSHIFGIMLATLVRCVLLE